jgi:hypothetical protein
MDVQTVVYLTRALLQLGVSVEQYRAAASNPDMSDEELANHLKSNSDKIQELRDKDH